VEHRSEATVYIDWHRFIVPTYGASDPKASSPEDTDFSRFSLAPSPDQPHRIAPQASRDKIMPVDVPEVAPPPGESSRALVK
jgi:hypothetical protein